MKHSQEPWEVDHKDTDGGDGRYDYFFIIDRDGKVICDTSNSDVQCIRENYDEHGCYRWDEQGEIDLKRAAECVNALAGVGDPSNYVSDLKAKLETANEMIQSLEKNIAAIPAICRGETVPCAMHVSQPIIEMKANLEAEIRRLKSQ